MNSISLIYNKSNTRNNTQQKRRNSLSRSGQRREKRIRRKGSRLIRLLVCVMSLAKKKKALLPRPRASRLSDFVRDQRIKKKEEGRSAGKLARDTKDARFEVASLPWREADCLLDRFVISQKSKERERKIERERDREGESVCDCVGKPLIIIDKAAKEIRETRLLLSLLY